MPPMPTVWWLRPVSSAARVGEHSAVVWKRLYFSPSAGQPLGGRRLARPAERARRAEADVVEQDDQHVRRARRRPQRLDRRERRVGILRVLVDRPVVRRSGIGSTSRSALTGLGHGSSSHGMG